MTQFQFGFLAWKSCGIGIDPNRRELRQLQGFMKICNAAGRFCKLPFST